MKRKPAAETTKPVRIDDDTNATLDLLAVTYRQSKRELMRLAVITAREVWNTHGKIEIHAATKAA